MSSPRRVTIRSGPALVTIVRRGDGTGTRIDHVTGEARPLTDRELGELRDRDARIAEAAALGPGEHERCPRCGHLTRGTREGRDVYCTTCGGIL